MAEAAPRTLYAFTPAVDLPPYVNVGIDDGGCVTIEMRGSPGLLGGMPALGPTISFSLGGPESKRFLAAMAAAAGDDPEARDAGC